jgi:hypothetical protein
MPEVVICPRCRRALHPIHLSMGEVSCPDCGLVPVDDPESVIRMVPSGPAASGPASPAEGYPDDDDAARADRRLRRLQETEDRRRERKTADASRR